MMSNHIISYLVCSSTLPLIATIFSFPLIIMPLLESNNTIRAQTPPRTLTKPPHHTYKYILYFPVQYPLPRITYYFTPMWLYLLFPFPPFLPEQGSFLRGRRGRGTIQYRYVLCTVRGTEVYLTVASSSYRCVSIG